MKIRQSENEKKEKNVCCERFKKKKRKETNETRKETG
jgi:hypothetical protein